MSCSKIRLFLVAVSLSTPAIEATYAKAPIVEALLSGKRTAEVIASGNFTINTYQYEVIDKDSTRYGLKLFLGEITAGSARIKIIPVNDYGQTTSIYKSLNCNEHSVRLTGAFYAISESGARYPINLVISEGKTLSNFERTKFGGVIVQVDNKIDIVRVSKITAPVVADEALQSSPIVTWESKNDMLRDDKQYFNRIAFGFGEHSLNFAGAFSQDGRAVSLFEFAQILEAMPDITGSKISKMIALDGGPSAHIYISAIDTHLGYESESYVPNAICIEPR